MMKQKPLCCRCQPFSTYPRSYDLLHAFHLFSHYQGHVGGCLLEDIMLEIDRIIRPQVNIDIYSLLFIYTTTLYFVSIFDRLFDQRNMSYMPQKAYHWVRI